MILNYADIDPSHFGKDVTITKETVPITREQFFEGTKHLGQHLLTSDDDGTSIDVDDDIKKGYGSKFNGTPTVVKTTTRQVITRDDDGITRNVEEKVQNLGTGEVTFLTQEHKVR